MAASFGATPGDLADASDAAVAGRFEAATAAIRRAGPALEGQARRTADRLAEIIAG